MQRALEWVPFVGPLLVAAGTVPLSRWVLPRDAWQRYALAIAFAAAFLAGYAVLPEWAQWIPDRHWHWLPCLVAAAAVVGPQSLARGVFPVEQWLVRLGLVAVAAWLLVPDWSSLTLPRTVWVPALAAYLLLVMQLLDLLPPRLTGRWFPLLLAVAACGTAGLVAAFVSLRYAQLAGVAAAAAAGSCLLAGRAAEGPLTRGLIPVYVLAVGGTGFVGCIEPEPALPALLLPPAAPLALWLYALTPLGRLRGVTAAGVQLALVLLPVAAAAVWLLAGNSTTAEPLPY